MLTLSMFIDNFKKTDNHLQNIAMSIQSSLDLVDICPLSIIISRRTSSVKHLQLNRSVTQFSTAVLNQFVLHLEYQ